MEKIDGWEFRSLGVEFGEVMNGAPGAGEGRGWWCTDFDPDPRYLVNVNRLPERAVRLSKDKFQREGEPPHLLQGPHVVVLQDPARPIACEQVGWIQDPGSVRPLRWMERAEESTTVGCWEAWGFWFRSFPGLRDGAAPVLGLAHQWGIPAAPMISEEHKGRGGEVTGGSVSPWLPLGVGLQGPGKRG